MGGDGGGSPPINPEKPKIPPQDAENPPPLNENLVGGDPPPYPDADGKNVKVKRREAPKILMNFA